MRAFDRTVRTSTNFGGGAVLVGPTLTGIGVLASLGAGFSSSRNAQAPNIPSPTADATPPTDAAITRRRDKPAMHSPNSGTQIRPDDPLRHQSFRQSPVRASTGCTVVSPTAPRRTVGDTELTPARPGPEREPPGE
ncbi:hypothetical protein Aglo01_28820 [Actinokineospora globicatena]|nr:hypothetical protein Aglo01_28820 [Actinokineospora globicatena]GLW84936.1 hypothetical protein Aglo02_25760 [Actinokineospora globicatena]